MGVSVTGAGSRPLTRVGSVGAVVGLLGGAAFYLYGPPVAPALHSAAAAECNRLTGGSYRSYRLEWAVGVHARPHWTCGDRRDPAAAPVDLGWWVTPSW